MYFQKFWLSHKGVLAFPLVYKKKRCNCFKKKKKRYLILKVWLPYEEKDAAYLRNERIDVCFIWLSNQAFLQDSRPNDCLLTPRKFSQKAKDRMWRTRLSSRFNWHKASDYFLYFFYVSWYGIFVLKIKCSLTTRRRIQMDILLWRVPMDKGC